MDIGNSISRAIKEGKWLDIQYRHKEGEITYFWAAILDIDFENKKFVVSMFNDRKGLDTLKTSIFFEKIIYAKVIDFSDYLVPKALIEKIENNFHQCKWLKYDKYNHNILN